jgi:hypothetical protein
MTNEVKSQVTTVDISTQALRWVTDQIIRTQPGVYSLPHPDGGEVWICPFGSGKTPRVLHTHPGLVETSQLVEVYAPDGSAQRYAVKISIKEIHDERREVDVPDQEVRGLPQADRPEGPDAEAAPENGPQEP